jgi:hypothetical protein
MFNFPNSLETHARRLQTAVFHSSSTQRLSSFAGDLNLYLLGAKSFLIFAPALAGESFGSPLIFAAR